jgi:hypothetical protein
MHMTVESIIYVVGAIICTCRGRRRLKCRDVDGQQNGCNTLCKKVLLDNLDIGLELSCGDTIAIIFSDVDN